MRHTHGAKYWLADHQPAPRSAFATPRRVDWASVLVWLGALAAGIAVYTLGFMVIRRVL